MLEKERYIDLHRELHESPRRFTGLSLREWIGEIDQLMIIIFHQIHQLLYV